MQIFYYYENEDVVDHWHYECGFIELLPNILVLDLATE